jgi:hypothetical protein
MGEFLYLPFFSSTSTEKVDFAKFSAEKLVYLPFFSIISTENMVSGRFSLKNSCGVST